MAKHSNPKPNRKAQPSARASVRSRGARGGAPTPEMVARGVVAAVVEQVAAVFDSDKPSH